MNPEGRAVEGSTPVAASAQPNSSVWQRLFPQTVGSSDEEFGEAVPTPEGFELGHFVLQERIGIGGMGAVFRAMDTRLQRIVALKVLGPAQSRDESSVRRFQNEASAAARLDHENIARVFYIGEDQGLYYIAFEYITGTNLRDLIREKGPLPPMDAVNVTLQIASALNHTHAAGVVHRDIKPSNIIIMPNGRAKLVDLGLARKQNSDSVADLTLAGTTLGTFDYISPEQAKDPRTADVKSDIYSLGCTLYHALTGVPPYPEGTVLQKLLDHQGKEAPDPILKNRQIPIELSHICRKMMASDPKQRYATPEHLVRDLMPLAVRMGLKGMPADGLIWRHITPPKENFWQRNLGWVASVALLLLIVFVIWRFPSLGSGPANNSLTDHKTGTSPNFSAKRAPAESKTSSSPTENNAGNPPVAVPSRNLEPGDVGPLADVLSTPNEETPKPPFGIKSVIEERQTEPDEIASKPIEPSVGPEELPEKTNTENPMPGEPVTPSLPAETEIRPYWVIHNDGSDDESKLTLEAACTAAGDGQIVEIRHNGLLPESISKPIRIKNKSLTIRAGENYRPLLKFSGVETPADGLLTRLFQLSNGSLDLINLDFHLAPPKGAMSDDVWALAALEGSGRVLLQGVTVTVDEQDQGLAAIVELLPTPTSEAVKDMKMMNQENEGRQESFEIRVLKSFLRGSCNVFHTRHTLPGRIEVEQSAVAVEGSLLKAEGDLDLKSEKDRVELTLNHTTCLVGNSLILFDNGQTPRDLLPVHVRNTRDNLIATNTSSPLIAMAGDSELEVYERLLRWEGLKNFYDGFDAFWTLPSGQFAAQSFDSWLKLRNTTDPEAQNGGIYWLTKWVMAESADITTKDLMLDPDPSLQNPAIDGATDRTDVGVDLMLLPRLPARDLITQP